jgi:hypothetical protein
VDEAKSALENATMAEDEKQIVMVPTAAAQPDKSDQKTSTTRAENRMCGTVTRNGHQVQACGRVVGNENFIARMDALEKELKRAEEELAEAEIAYRRGVD